MGKKKRLCVLCGKELPKGNFGNNPEPLRPFSSGVCCDDCNRIKVIPARLSIRGKQEVRDEQAL